MIPNDREKWNGHLGKSSLYTACFNTAIAGFITGMGWGADFKQNLIFSQCIGLSISTAVHITCRFYWSASPMRQVMVVLVVICAATTIGASVAMLIGGTAPSAFFSQHPHFLQTLLLGLCFGAVGTWFFVSSARIASGQARIREEQIKRLTSEKRAAEAYLRQLQAQIEPHFLFNTLSHVIGLMETDVEKGKAMLMDFVQYLRAGLSRIRDDEGRLETELELIRAYLNLYQVRMGKRLNFSMEVPERLKAMAFPPMLLQPLVENAIRHGLEPKTEGGSIVLRADLRNNLLRLEVADTGLGFSQNGHAGMGLDNVRQRLRSLYEDKARLILEENRPTGVKAIIEVPYDEHAGDHRR